MTTEVATDKTQTCPRRVRELGPWEHGQGLDRWRTDRWTTDHAAAEAERQAWLERNPNGSIGETNGEWLWSWGPPRVCSFCGGIHPDDAIRLLEEGWELETTGKNYKRYLHPPGYHARMATILQHVRETGQFGVAPSVWDPAPPVKLYVMHFTDEQLERFNAALARRRPQESS